MGAILGMQSMFKNPNINAPAMPPSAIPPTLADPNVAAARLRAQGRAKQGEGAGFGGTVQNTGGTQGVKMGQGDIASPSLLG